MKIETTDGRLEFDRGNLERATTRDSFLHSVLGADAEVVVQNGAHITYRVHPEKGIAANVYFLGPSLRSVAWQFALPPEKEGSWSVDLELERKHLHDGWLRAVIGEPPYCYSWGRVESDYDSKGCASSIILSYAD